MLELVLSAVAGGCGILVGGRGLKRRRRLQDWRRALEGAGLEVGKGGGVWSPQRLMLQGKAGTLEVRIESTRDQEKDVRLAILVPGPPDFPQVKIRRELHRLFRREIEVGDEKFDDGFYVAGPPLLVRALLDAKMRRLLIRANARHEISIVDGELRVSLSDAQIRGFLPFFLDLARLLAQPLDPVASLARNVRRDPASGVRLHNLLLLIRELPDHPATAEALHSALTDVSPQVRLCAAKEMGEAGRDVLLALAALKKDDALSAEAVTALGRHLSFEQARKLLGSALVKRRTRTAGACLDRLGQSREMVDFDMLAKAMKNEQGDLAVVAAIALGATGKSAAEPLLIQALQREHRDLRIAAAKALGRLGSTVAVLPLQEAAERSPLNLDLRKATRQSIAEIQTRLAGASPGQLSLAEAEAGQLSLAVDPAGQLSISGRIPDPRPSLLQEAGLVDSERRD